MPKRDNTILLVLGGAAALWWMSQRRAVASTPDVVRPPEDIGGHGDFPSYDIDVGGYADVSGGIGNGIVLAQKPYKAGTTVQGSVAWNAQTSDVNGMPISWPYKLIVRLEHATWGIVTAQQEWDSYTVNRADQSHGAVTSNFTLKIPLGAKEGDLGSIRVELQGARSDSKGKSISGDYTTLATGGETNILMVQSPDVYAFPGGMLGDITLMKGTGMKQLGLNQARPPGGYKDGIGEPRNWPRSGDNLELPGVKVLVRQPTFRGVSKVGYGRRMAVV